jgi:glyoxylase-like metal-dependent hydrolase (beta-lactamase superfamily II)
MTSHKIVCNGIYQIGGSSLSHPSDCSIYIIDVGNSEYIMIDSGAGESYSELKQNIKSAGLPPERIKALILTHCHIDHIGAANYFKETYGCKIIAHKLDADAIEGRDKKATAASWYGVDYKPVTIDIVISGDSKIMQFGNLKFNLIHTPGHTPGSISVYCDISNQRVLFGQDIHGPFDPSFGSNMDDWKKSMNNLLSLEADIMCEGHFGVYKPKEEVKKYIEGYLIKYSD